MNFSVPLPSSASVPSPITWPVEVREVIETLNRFASV